MNLLSAAPDGTIWTGYTGYGCFLGKGVDRYGIARFSRSKRLWGFNHKNSGMRKCWVEDVMSRKIQQYPTDLSPFWPN